MTEVRETRAAKASRAWKRLLLEKDGSGFNADAKIALKDLLHVSQFFGAQYDVSSPERTLELAVKRQIVIHIIACVDIDVEAKVKKLLEVQNDE